MLKEYLTFVYSRVFWGFLMYSLTLCLDWWEQVSEKSGHSPGWGNLQGKFTDDTLACKQLEGDKHPLDNSLE